MAKSLKKKEYKKIIVIFYLLTSMISFLLIMIVAMSLGWFSSNQEVFVDSITISSVNDDTNIEYSIYKYSGSADGIIEESANLKDFSFNTYDVVFAEDNQYTPIVIRIGISGQSVLKKGTLTLTVLRNTDIPAADNTSSSTIPASVFTSIIDFSSEIDSSYFGNGTPTGIFNNVNNAIHPDTKNFTYKNGDIFEKHENLTFEIPYEADSWNGDVLNVYLYMTYNNSLAQSFFDAQTDVNTNLDENFKFVNDIKSITVDYS